MKRILSILLLLLICLSVFASCDTETDNSNAVSAESKAESSIEKIENSSDESETVSVSDDSSISDVSENPYISNLPYDYVIPEFDKSKVIYNPNNSHRTVHNDTDIMDPSPNFGIPFDKDKLIVAWGRSAHGAMGEYIENNDVPDDAWFPVRVSSATVYTADGEIYEFDGLPELLERIGFLAVEDSNETIANPERAAIGYINMDMLWKIHRDGYSRVVEFEWYPEKCEYCPYDATQND